MANHSHDAVVGIELLVQVDPGQDRRETPMELVVCVMPNTEESKPITVDLNPVINITYAQEYSELYNWDIEVQAQNVYGVHTDHITAQHFLKNACEYYVLCGKALPPQLQMAWEVCRSVAEARSTRSGDSTTDLGLADLERAAQDRAVATIKASGAVITQHETDGSIIAIDLSNAGFGSTDLKDLLWLRSIEKLDLSGRPLSDSDLVSLRGFKNLKELDLSWTEITNAGLEHLSGLEKLRWLDLTRTGVDQVGVFSITDRLPGAEIVH